MKANDFVRIKYSGKVKETDQVFDSGDDLCVIVGAGHILKGLDKALEQMNVGEKKVVEIVPEDGFGQRKAELIKLVPLSEFKRHGTKPYPGMVVNADNRQGRVLSVTSGRVKVDFNHPLAGKVLVYEVEIKEKVVKDEDKVKGLVNFYTKIEPDKLSVSISENQIEITTPPLIHPVMKKKIADDIRKYIRSVPVKFSEIFEAPKEDSAKK